MHCRVVYHEILIAARFIRCWTVDLTEHVTVSVWQLQPRCQWRKDVGGGRRVQNVQRTSVQWTSVWQWHSRELLTTSAESGRKCQRETRNYSQEGTRRKNKHEWERKQDRTVGLVTRCVLLLLYGGLLHHQNIKCPAGKRAHAWVHPHYTFNADCWLNRATFSRFLAPENILDRPSPIPSHSLFLSFFPMPRSIRIPAFYCPFFLPVWFTLSFDITNFTCHLARWIFWISGST